MGLRITSWNVNGIRNPFSYQPWRENKTFQAMFDVLEADIVVMQETKIQRKDLQDDMVLVPGWDVFFSLPKFKKGYSGVAIYTRNSKCCPIRAEEGITGVLSSPNSTTSYRDLPSDQQIGGYPRPGQVSGPIDEATLDSEGRCVILEFPAFVLIGVYSPATRDQTRTDFRLGYHDALDARIRNLVAMGKQVVLTGDLNIIRGELDTAGLVETLKKEEMSFEDFISMPSRRFFNQFVFGGNVVGEKDEGREEPVMWDLGREYHPSRKGMYTCWETRKNARPGNYGSRIDYVLCSDGIRSWFVDSNIQEGLLGSDHCPVFATLGDTVQTDGEDKKVIHVLDRMNPEGMFHEGERVREWSAKDLLPLSARLIPDFDRRQSIKDMFFKKANPSAKTKIPSSFSQEGSTKLSQAQPESATPPPQASEVEPAAASQISSTNSAAPPSSTTTAFSSQSITTQKRPPAAPPPSASRPQKKIKGSATTKDASKPGLGKSQTNLMGFFTKLKVPPQHTQPSKDLQGYEDTREAAPSDPPPLTLQTKRSPSAILGAPSFVFNNKADKGATPNGGSEAASSSGTGTGGGGSKDLDDAKVVFDPIESKESWSKLLGKRVAPKCEHDEPCISMLTKKPGVNCGRSFYVCGRPLGPSGAKEKGTEWRCGTFIWSSDWTGGGTQQQ